MSSILIYVGLAAVLIIFCSKTGQTLLTRLIKDLFSILKLPGEILYKISRYLQGEEDIEREVEKLIREKRAREIIENLKGGDKHGGKT